MSKHRLKSTVAILVLTGLVSGCAKFSYSDIRPLSKVSDMQTSLMTEPEAAEKQTQTLEGVRKQNKSAKKAKTRATKPIDLAKDHLRHNRLGLAIQAFRQDIVENGETAQNLNGMAIAYDQLQRFDVAKRFYQKALRAAPDSVETRNNFAVSLMRQGNGEEALDVLADIKRPEDEATADVIDNQRQLAEALSERSRKSLAQLKNRLEVPARGYRPQLAVKKVAKADWTLATPTYVPRNKAARVLPSDRPLDANMRAALDVVERRAHALSQRAGTEPVTNRSGSVYRFAKNSVDRSSDSVPETAPETAVVVAPLAEATSTPAVTSVSGKHTAALYQTRSVVRARPGTSTPEFSEPAAPVAPRVAEYGPAQAAAGANVPRATPVPYFIVPEQAVAPSFVEEARRVAGQMGLDALAPGRQDAAAKPIVQSKCTGCTFHFDPRDAEFNR